MSNTGIKIVFGGAAFGHTWQSPEDVSSILDVLEKCNVKVIDTAQLYGESEALLGKTGAADRFIIDTKDPVAFGGEVSKDVIVERGHESLKKLKTKKVDIFYLHCPPAAEKMNEVLAAMNTLHKAGVYSRFGVSNFSPEEVETAYAHCKEQNYVLPSVYQGNYNPVARRQETELFPVLKKLGMAFYAYSPLAGGFLTKTKEQIQEGAGRFNENDMLGKMYKTLYAKPSYLDALAQWQAVAEKEGASRAELAYRWVVYNSPLKPENGDAIIIGASRAEQLTNTVEFLKKGPLSQAAVDGIDKIWKTIEHDAPLDNYKDYVQANGLA